MKNKYLILLLAVLMGTSLQAQWGKRVRGNGNVVKETREVGTFDAISVSHIFTVSLVPGDEGSLTVEGEENLLEYVVTKVSGNRLEITVKKGYQLQVSAGKKDGIRVVVPVRDLSEASASGASDLTSTFALKADRFKTSVSGAADIRLQLDAGDVEAEMSGAGTLKLSGTARSVDINGSGAADLKAYELTAGEVRAELSGSSDVQITATRRITARVSGASDLRYKGNPEFVDTKTSGAASVKKS